MPVTEQNSSGLTDVLHSATANCPPRKIGNSTTAWYISRIEQNEDGLCTPLQTLQPQ